MAIIMSRDSKVLEDQPALGLLAVAVPLRIAEVRRLPDGERARLAREAAEHIASHGDDLMYRGRKGAAAEAFNKLATGLAVLALQPGGVTFAGMQFEAGMEADE
jgi:hypothetical protein